MDQDERFDVYIGSLEAELPDWLAGLERRAFPSSENRPKVCCVCCLF